METKIEPACVYCANGTESADGQMIFCEKRGAVAPYYSCRRFEYDPFAKPKPRRCFRNMTRKNFSYDPAFAVNLE